MTTKEKTKNTVLVVEDETALRTALVEMVGDAGFEMLEAADGKEGLKLALKEHPDLILLDLIMPVMDGMEMLNKLRKDKWGKNVYVYILTNKEPDDELIEEAKRKPYRSSYLMKSECSITYIVDLVEKYFKKNSKNL